MAGVDGAHSIVGSVESVTLDGTLHGDTSIEDDVDKGIDVEGIIDRSKGRVLSDGMTSEGT